MKACSTQFDPVWYRAPTVVLQRPLEFFPSRGMTPTERLNAMVRFILYGSVLVALYRNDATVLGIGLVVTLVLTLVHMMSHKARKGQEEYDSHSIGDNAREGLTKCTAPTKENPFMNTLTNEFSTNKKPPCPQTPCIEKKTQDAFEEGLVRELSDVYNKRASDRQFYTTPVTGNGTPDTQAFRNYLFSETVKGPKCK